MKILNERQNEIIKILNSSGYATVQELSEKLKVSLVTIRKDLTFLENEGFLYRTHGGASKQSRYAFEQNINEKENIFVEEKKKIALKASKLINNNDFIMIASGTTVHYLARILRNFDYLTVVTPSLRVAIDLCSEKNIHTIHLGGEVRKSSISTVGIIAEETLENFSFNKLFLGIDGIDIEFGISTSNASEAHLNQLMIEKANEVIVLADGSKMQKKGFGKICGLNEIDILITDNSADKDFIKQLEKTGIEVIIA